MVQNLQKFAFWNLIIRPPRAKYTRDVLGPADFTFDGGQGKRRDVELRTKRGSRIACSHFVPVFRGVGIEDMKPIPVVIYLHGNTSNRLEAWDLVVPFLKRGVSLFCFDAAGCGMSEGEYISLGWYERHDLADIVAHLRKSTFCGPIALWGWSMGAVTALLYADSDPALAAMCLESPFASLRKLVEDLAQQGTQISVKLPHWLIEPVINLVKMRVEALAEFDIDTVLPLESAKKARAPCIFVSRRNDTFVQDHHTEELLSAYAGDCEHVVLEGDHSCTRTSDDIKHVVDFFCRAFVPHQLSAAKSSSDLSAAKSSSAAQEDQQQMPIPEEHEQKHPEPRSNRPVTSCPPSGWPDLAAIAGEPSRSLPRFLELSAGVHFPEPRPLPPIGVEPSRALPLGQEVGARVSGVTARPRP